MSTFLALALSALTLLTLLTLTTALPVLVDVRPWLLGLALTSAVVAGWRARHPATSVVRGTFRLLLVVMVGIAALAAWDLMFAYRTDEVAFANGDVTLRGTLYLPSAAGPHPAVVLVHGSGRQPRDEYRFYARHYARAGIAALAWDKRGSGESTGTVDDAPYPLLASDAVAAVVELRSRSDIDAARVGLWGLSEGEWVAPLAALEADAAFLVLVSGSAMTPAEQVGYETGELVRRAGFGEAAAQEATKLYAALSEFQRTGEGREALNARLAVASREPWFGAARYLEPSVPSYDRVLAVDWFPAWRQRMDFTAAPVLARLSCPVLAQVGGRDPKNDGALTLDRLRVALAAGGNTAFTGRAYPDAVHGLIEWRLGENVPPPFFAEGYLDDQIGWVQTVTRTR